MTKAWETSVSNKLFNIKFKFYCVMNLCTPRFTTKYLLRTKYYLN